MADDQPMPRRTLASLSKAEIEQLAARRDTVIMQPEYDVFEPWPEDRVRACVNRLCRISRAAASAEDARREALKHEELKAFSERYVKMFERFSDPAMSRSEENVKVIMSMIMLHERMRAGEISETQAKAQVSDTALAAILRQTPGAPQPPREAAQMGPCIEEIDEHS